MNLIYHPEIQAVLTNLVIKTLPVLKDYLEIDTEGRSNYAELIDETVHYLIKKEKLRLNNQGKLHALQCLHIEQMFMLARDEVLECFANMQEIVQGKRAARLFKTSEGFCITGQHFDVIKKVRLIETMAVDGSSYLPCSYKVNSPNLCFALELVIWGCVALLGAVHVIMGLAVAPGAAAILPFAIAAIAITWGLVQCYAGVRQFLYPEDRMKDVKVNNLEKFDMQDGKPFLSPRIDQIFDKEPAYAFEFEETEALEDSKTADSIPGI